MINCFVPNVIYQQPHEIILGEYTDYVTKGTKRTLVTKTDKLIYIPILETSQQLLCNEDVLSQVCIVWDHSAHRCKCHSMLSPKVNNGHQRSDAFLEDFCDGSAFKAHPIFSVDPAALQIIAYFDEVEVCNPLGSHASVHKVGKRLP